MTTCFLSISVLHVINRQKLDKAADRPGPLHFLETLWRRKGEGGRDLILCWFDVSKPDNCATAKSDVHVCVFLAVHLCSLQSPFAGETQKFMLKKFIA